MGVEWVRRGGSSEETLLRVGQPGAPRTCLVAFFLGVRRGLFLELAYRGAPVLLVAGWSREGALLPCGAFPTVGRGRRGRTRQRLRLRMQHPAGGGAGFPETGLVGHRCHRDHLTPRGRMTRSCAGRGTPIPAGPQNSIPPHRMSAVGPVFIRMRALGCRRIRAEGGRPPSDFGPTIPPRQMWLPSFAQGVDDASRRYEVCFIDDGSLHKASGGPACYVGASPKYTGVVRLSVTGLPIEHMVIVASLV